MSRQDLFSSLIIFITTKFSISRQDFFSSPYPWLCCLLQHRDLCYEKLDLANLNSFSIPIVTKFYRPTAFIVTTINFFVATKILPSIFHYVAT